MASAANTMLRCASIESFKWWNTGYADLPVMPTTVVNVLARVLGGAERSA